MGPGTGLDDLERRNILPLVGLELCFLGRRTRKEKCKGESISRSQMDIKRKTCDIRTCKTGALEKFVEFQNI
jgi:hypothetical protein